MLMNCPVFLPSKDRACQLDLLMRSILRFQIPVDLNVVYQSSDSSYDDGYSVVKSENWFYETWSQQQWSVIEEFTHFLKRQKEKGVIAVGIATDDCVFFRKPPAHNIFSLFKENDDLFCFTYRQGLNTTIQDYKIQSLQTPLSYYNTCNGMIDWNWKIYPALENRGYAGGQDFCFYRIEDLEMSLELSHAKTMRDLESWMALNRHVFLRETMMSPEHSCCVNIPANNMQEPRIENAFDSYSAEDLNKMFLNGYRITLERITRENIVGAHQPINYEFYHVQIH